MSDIVTRSLAASLGISLAFMGFAYAKPAGSATMAEAETGSNFFTVPSEQSEIPSFNQIRNGEGRLRKMLLGAEKDDIPDFRQIRMLPTLTAAQRKSLTQSFGNNKTKVQEITTRLRELKDKNTANGGTLISDPNARAEFDQLRKQLQDMRRQSWEELKTQLTAQQLQDLQAMRKGELRPATFRGETADQAESPMAPMMQEPQQ